MVKLAEAIAIPIARHQWNAVAMRCACGYNAEPFTAAAFYAHQAGAIAADPALRPFVLLPPEALDVDTFLKGLDSANHSEQSRRDWVDLFYRSMLFSMGATE